MKRKIISAIAALSVVSAQIMSVSAAQTPTIIVDERELVFADQGPVIVEETERTLIPLRFVLESCGAKVTWNGEDRTVTVDSGDNRNRVVLTIDSDEMQMYYYPSVRDYVSDTVTLDQPPVIMNDRTMIPVRAVLEALGATVEWDEENAVIDITSRAYARYMRDRGVEGYEVVYPLSGGEVSFDPAPESVPDTAYDPSAELPAISISADQTEVPVGETFDVYVNIANADKAGAGAFLTTMTVTLKYDSSKLRYDGYTYLNGEEEYSPVMDATNPVFLDDSLKIVSIANLGLEETEPTQDGAIAKITFEVLSDGETGLELSSRSHPQYGFDTTISFMVDGENKAFDDVNELYIDKTPVVINAE